MDIAGSARKHGVADRDIHHAASNPIRMISQDDAATLVIGADRAGQLLEVVVIDHPDQERLAIHAMPLRRNFRDRYLR